MGKLGKKARKFAKKNLQSVHRQRRKTNAVFKKRSSKKNVPNNSEKKELDTKQLASEKKTDVEETVNTSLDAVFPEDERDIDSDASASDGYLSEDASCPGVEESESEGNLQENCDTSALAIQNRKIHEELALQMKKLNKLRKKDPEFVKFLQRHEKVQKDSMDSDEEGASYQHLEGENDVSGRLVTSTTINTWSQLITEGQSEPALTKLLNAYRAACHLGAELSGLSEAAAPHTIQSSDTFAKIFIFMLGEADNIFRGMLKIPSTNCKKETILGMKNSSKWKKLKPLVKSYLGSTLFFLKQATDSDILAFTLTQLRASIIFFADFPSLLQRLIKIVVPLWATGGGALSKCSFHIIRDAASLFKSDCFDSCFNKLYKAYIASCRNLETVDVRLIEFLGNSFVELCSLDVQRACGKALLSMQQLGYILRQALRNDKDSVKKICSWQYAKCIDVWVLFISTNVRDHDIQSLLYMMIQLINGVANLFSGPRYFPLRVKCIQWLNKLSSSSGIFIPVASLVLDILDYKLGKEGGKPGEAVNYSTLLKLPKYWLKTQKFKDECVYAAIELLSTQFLQWCFHISFPELATPTLIRLKKYHEVTTIEGLRRVVKRMIDQVEQNVEFVQKKRDEVAFSPKDYEASEQFMQLEKSSAKAPFVQYYRSVLEKAAAKNMTLDDKKSLSQQESLKRKRDLTPSNLVDDANKALKKVRNASKNSKKVRNANKDSKKVRNAKVSSEKEKLPLSLSPSDPSVSPLGQI